MIPTAADGYEYASDLGASLSGRLTGLRYRHHLVDMGLGTVPICDSRRFHELSLSLRVFRTASMCAAERHWMYYATRVPSSLR